MRVAVIGSRGYPDLGEVYLFMTQEFSKDDILVSGGAGGVDSAAEEYAIRLGIERDIYAPEYGKYGRGAPLKRNADIVDGCDRAVVFWDGRSNGTRDTIRKLVKARKNIDLRFPKAGLGTATS